MPHVWNGDRRDYLLASDPPRRQNKKFATRPRALIPKGTLDRATNLIQAVTRVYHFAAADLSRSSNKKMLATICRSVEPLCKFAGGEKGTQKIIKSFAFKLNTRLHEPAEKFLKKYDGGASDKDLIAKILSTAYANSVDIFHSDRELAMAKPYLSSYLKHTKNLSLDNTDPASLQKLRRKAINNDLAAFRADEANHIKARDVPLYRRFGCHDRQSYGATLARRSRPPTHFGKRENSSLDTYSDDKEMEVSTASGYNALSISEVGEGEELVAATTLL